MSPAAPSSSALRPHPAAAPVLGPVLGPVLSPVLSLVLGLVACGGERADSAAVGASGIGAASATSGGPAAATPAPFVDGPLPPYVHGRGDAGAFRLQEIMSGGAALADLDRDGDLDAVLVHGDPAAGGLALWNGRGDGRFDDASARLLDQPAGFGMGCAVGDADDDGRPDLYITTVGPDVLLRQSDAGFADASADVGLGDPGYGSSATWFDADLDGDLDLYVARYLDLDSPDLVCRREGSHLRDYCNPTAYRPVADRFYRNEGGRFADASVGSGVGAYRGFGLAVLASDLDQDGAVDLYVANDQSPAFLWRNTGGARFVESAAVLGCAYDRDGRAIAGMGAVAEDFDGDLDLDLFVTNIREMDHLVLRRDDAGYRDVSRQWARGGWLRDDTGFGVACFDQDHDGALDLYVAHGGVSALEGGPAGGSYAQRDGFARWRDGRFEPSGWTPPGDADVARAVARGDVDGDGDVDLLVARNGAAPRLLLNTADGAGHWLGVEVLDERGRPLLNSRVQVTVGERTWLHEVRAQESYLASRDPRVHVGLGPHARVDEVLVQTPDGRRRRLRDVAADAMVTVRFEGDG